MTQPPRSIILAFLLALPSCGSNDNDPGPGGVTIGEAEALNQAAEMLDERTHPFPENATGNDSGGE